MLIALMLVGGLACLAVGLLLASAAWLILSLAASLLAGLLLYLTRSRTARRIPLAARRLAFAASSRSRPTGPAAQTGRPAHAAAAPTPRRAEVWVVGGRVRYHRQECQLLAGQDAEPIPWTQASEDGFVACSLCEPD